MSNWAPGDDEVEFEFGVWVEMAREASSNYRELANLVAKLERLWAADKLHAGTEIFLFTDNFTAESVFTRGSGKSPEIFSLILRLHKLQMEGNIFVHVVWIAGTRMIAWGGDGLSRGDLSNGVMAGQDTLYYVPIGRSAIERFPGAETIIPQIALSDEVWVRLSPAQWYSDPFVGDGNYLWVPPPCLADVALEQMAEAHQIRPWNTHAFLVPNLMTHRWRKSLTKACDLLVTLPFDDDIWPKKTQYESLTLAVAFPLLRRAPWRAKRSNFFVQQRTVLRGLSRGDFPRARDCLRELWLYARTMDPLSRGLAR
jgi:hypothetical protein